jgi:hypothetical protein
MYRSAWLTNIRLFSSLASSTRRLGPWLCRFLSAKGHVSISHCCDCLDDGLLVKGRTGFDGRAKVEGKRTLPTKTL